MPQKDYWTPSRICNGIRRATFVRAHGNVARACEVQAALASISADPPSLPGGWSRAKVLHTPAPCLLSFTGSKTSFTFCGLPYIGGPENRAPCPAYRRTPSRACAASGGVFSLVVRRRDARKCDLNSTMARGRYR